MSTAYSIERTQYGSMHHSASHGRTAENYYTADSSVGFLSSLTCPRDLNHYSFGSILEWLFASVAGLRHTYEKPGFRRAVVAPLPNWDLRFVSCDHHASVGTWHVGWECIDENHLHFELTVPFGCEAEITLPYATEKAYRALGGHILSAGTYAITYRTTRPLRRRSIIDWLS